jgi:hypothetical protein
VIPFSTRPALARDEMYLSDLVQRFPVSRQLWTSMSSLTVAFLRASPDDGEGSGRWRAYTAQMFEELVLRRVLTAAAGLRGVPTTWLVERDGTVAVGRSPGGLVAEAAIPADVCAEWGWVPAGRAVGTG